MLNWYVFKSTAQLRAENLWDDEGGKNVVIDLQCRETGLRTRLTFAEEEYNQKTAALKIQQAVGEGPVRFHKARSNGALVVDSDNAQLVEALNA